MNAIILLACIATASAQWVVPNAWGNTWAHGYPYNNLAYSANVIAAPHHGAVVAAAPAVVAAAPAVVGATKTQYHSQDELGQAAWGHSQPGQAHAAVRDAAGGVSGSFSYISPEGIPFTTHYRADHNGYRVASNALPVAPAASVVGPVDTPEVVAAKVAHANAHILARGKRQAVVGSVAHTPANTVLTPTYLHTPVVHAAVAAPAVFRSAVHHPVVHHSTQVVHAAPAAVVRSVATPVVHHAAVASPVVHHAAPVAYSSVVAAAPAVRAATLTRIVNTPGHAVSYRVD